MKNNDKRIINFICRILTDVVTIEGVTVLALIIIFSVYFLPIKFVFRMILAIIIFIIYLFLLFRKRKQNNP